MEKENFRNKELERVFYENYNNITNELTKNFNYKIGKARDPNYVFGKLQQEQSNITNDKSRRLGFLSRGWCLRKPLEKPTNH